MPHFFLFNQIQRKISTFFSLQNRSICEQGKNKFLMNGKKKILTKWSDIHKLRETNTVFFHSLSKQSNPIQSNAPRSVKIYTIFIIIIKRNEKKLYTQHSILVLNNKLNAYATEFTLKSYFFFFSFRKCIRNEWHTHIHTSMERERI